ncbi:MAG TPA: DUF551 domain-containing protein [Rhabdochlamydiaceae bacterium]|jgi:hypothetical protein
MNDFTKEDLKIMLSWRNDMVYTKKPTSQMIVSNERLGKKIQSMIDNYASMTKMIWNNVKDKLPHHNQIVLVFAKTIRSVDGYGVATFIDSIKMNEELSKGPYANECVDVNKNPYYFVSQEVRQHIFNNVSHWMPLPEAPE